MPKLSVWMVRASLLYMGTGFLFGALILLQKGLPFDGRVWRLLHAHTEVMVYGWTMQLVMGVAFFALPRFSDHTRRYGRVVLGWWSFYLLNVGVVLTAASYWFGMSLYAFLGRVLVTLAVLLYVVMIWSRVKAFGVG